MSDTVERKFTPQEISQTESDNDYQHYQELFGKFSEGGNLNIERHKSDETSTTKIAFWLNKGTDVDRLFAAAGLQGGQDIFMKTREFAAGDAGTFVQISITEPQTNSKFQSLGKLKVEVTLSADMATIPRKDGDPAPAFEQKRVERTRTHEYAEIIEANKNGQPLAWKPLVESVTDHVRKERDPSKLKIMDRDIASYVTVAGYTALPSEQKIESMSVQ